MYFNWKFNDKGFHALEGVEMVLGGSANIFTGNVYVEFPGTRNCGDVRFCFLMTLEIGGESEADNEISGFTANNLGFQSW